MKTEQILTLEKERDEGINGILEGYKNEIINLIQRDACLEVHAEVYAEKISKVLEEK